MGIYEFRELNVGELNAPVACIMSYDSTKNRESLVLRLFSVKKLGNCPKRCHLVILPEEWAIKL